MLENQQKKYGEAHGKKYQIYMTSYGSLVCNKNTMCYYEVQRFSEFVRNRQKLSKNKCWACPYVINFVLEI